MTKRSTLKNLDLDENLITNTQFDVFDPVLYVSLIHHSLNALARIDSEDLQFLTKVKMSLCRFNLEQTYPFLELVYWCSVVYCHTAYILQNQKASKLLCSFTPQSIRATLGLPYEFFLNSIHFSEVVMVDSYKSYDPKKKGKFLKLILKPDSDIQSLEYPCPTNNFREEVQVIFSLLSQVLGLDHD